VFLFPELCNPASKFPVQRPLPSPVLTELRAFWGYYSAYQLRAQDAVGLGKCRNVAATTYFYSRKWYNVRNQQRRKVGIMEIKKIAFFRHEAV
jgi:hypothetical protein